jgi:hypothetical protein
VMSGETRVVGRIFHAGAGDPPNKPWMWTITAAVVMPAVRSHGFAATLQEAKTVFAEHWRRWLALKSVRRSARGSDAAAGVPLSHRLPLQSIVGA